MATGFPVTAAMASRDPLISASASSGRDRDSIARHTLYTEKDWAQKIGVFTPDGAMLTSEGLKAHRAAYCHSIRDYHSQGKLAGKMAKWPLRFLIRHTAFHTMDHAWEMEDRDLTT